MSEPLLEVQIERYVRENPDLPDHDVFLLGQVVGELHRMRIALSEIDGRLSMPIKSRKYADTLALVVRIARRGLGTDAN